MTDRLPVGPYRTLQVGSGVEMPYYIIPFDKHGICQGPETRRHLIDELKNGSYSDVFLFSHGWNNDWSVATARYEEFINGYQTLREKLDLPFPSDYKPLLIGIFWPSTLLVFGEKERGPEFAAAGASATAIEDAVISAERHELGELADSLSPDDAAALYRLAQEDRLEEDEARELAGLALDFINREDDELGATDRMSVDDLLAVWGAAEAEGDDLSSLIAGGAPQTAGIGDFFRKIDPRKAIRTLTVYQMKDRAGTVGANGVGPLLRDVLNKSSDARVHLIGHSYGGKVVLSAVSAGNNLPGRVHSMLLLQPAVSHLCFADAVPGTDPPRSGGYRRALQRVRLPILSTFSANDEPLTKFFHLAVRRKRDLGEERIAAAGEPPSKFAALGGFGPRRAGQQLIDILDPGTGYSFHDGVEIYGLNGTRTIAGHGDISVPSTWWALHQLASR